jgi:hypothetical protein
MKSVPSTNYVSEKTPKIISRFPVVDHEDFDFPLSMTMFAQPSGENQDGLSFFFHFFFFKTEPLLSAGFV